MGHNQNLLSFIERIERLEEEKKRLAEDISEIKKEAKSAWFDVKTINQMIRERKMGAEALREALDLAEIYRASLGMLDGTPLGTWARKRFLGKEDAPDTGETRPDMQAPELPDAPEVKVPALPPATPELIAAAKVEGGDAARAGRKVTENPYPASDARRAAWDEGWCGETGSDGMDIPAAFRRKPKKKPDGGEG